MLSCPGDRMEHGPPTTIFDRPGPQFYGQLAKFNVEARERIEAAGDFRGGGFRWDRSVKRLGIGWTPACKVPEAKVHIQGDGLPIARPLALRVDGKSGADSLNPRGEVFFGDISLSSYTSEEVHFEIATPTRATRSRGFRYAGGAKTGLAGGELVDVGVVPANVQYATGTTLNLHRGVAITGPTVSATTPKTLNVLATLYVTGPYAGTNVTLAQTYYYDTSYSIYSTSGAHFSAENANHNKPSAPVSICRPSPLGNMASGYEYRDLHISSGGTLAWTTAPPTTYRMVCLTDTGATLSSTAPATINDAASVYIQGPPIAGPNVTITRRHSLWVETGNVRFDGFLGIGVNVASFPLDVVSGNASDVARFRNSNAAGLAGVAFWDNVGSGNVQAAVGYGNASFAAPARAGRSYVWIGSSNFTLTNDTTHFLYVNNSSGLIGLFHNSPDRPLDIRTTNANELVRLRNTGAGLGGFIIDDSVGNTALQIGIVTGATGDFLISPSTGHKVDFVRPGGSIRWLQMRNDSSATNPELSYGGFLSSNVAHNFTQGAYTGAVTPTGLRFTCGAHTSLQDGDVIDVNIIGERTVQFGNNTARSLLRCIRFGAPTYSSTTATKAITEATLLHLSTLPSPSSNVTITRASFIYANNTFNPSSGATKFVGINFEPTINETGSASGGYAIYRCDVTETALLGSSFLLELRVGGSARTIVNSKGDTRFTQGVYTTGTPAHVIITPGAHTTLSNAETTDFQLALARTVQFGQNTTLATQRAVRIDAPTYASSAATKTITDAVTLDITAAPAAGTNVTITNPYALRVQAGETRLLGGLRVTGNLGFFAAAAAGQQTSGANLTNNVTAGGTNDTITNWTDLTTYATDAAAIRDAIYQLARKLKQINDGLRTYGMFT